jgi:hypothetical protein
VGTLGVPFEVDGDALRLRCRSGVLKASLA